jgi:hypothetical protein
VYENKKLFFPLNWKIEQIRSYYKGLVKEQHVDSPHRYETDEVRVSSGDIVVDLGAAEGFWGLMVIERVKRLYLFEALEEWIEPLTLTFRPWKDKVVIINKFINSFNDECNITLDAFLKAEKIKADFIKADLEGIESQFLEGARETLSKQENLKLSICTYHKQDDADRFNALLIKNGFQTKFSKGFFIRYSQYDLDTPYLRRGVLYGKK